MFTFSISAALNWSNWSLFSPTFSSSSVCMSPRISWILGKHSSKGLESKTGDEFLRSANLEKRKFWVRRLSWALSRNDKMTLGVPENFEISLKSSFWRESGLPFRLNEDTPTDKISKTELKLFLTEVAGLGPESMGRMSSPISWLLSGLSRISMKRCSSMSSMSKSSR